MKLTLFLWGADYISTVGIESQDEDMFLKLAPFGEVVYADKQPQKLREYRISAVPTVLYLDDNGEEVGRMVGFFNESQLKTFIESGGIRL